MKNDIIKIQEDFIELAGNLCASINVTRIIGQLYALLYMNEKPVSMDEMVERLKVSKGNISVNINILEGWGVVRKIGIRGSRKNYYSADTDIWKIVINRIEEGLNRRLDIVTSAITNIKNELEIFGSESEKNEKSSIVFYKERLEQIKKIEEKLNGVVKALSYFK